MEGNGSRQRLEECTPTEAAAGILSCLCKYWSGSARLGSGWGGGCSHLWRKLCLFLRAAETMVCCSGCQLACCHPLFVPPNNLWEACPWNLSTHSKQEPLTISAMKADEQQVFISKLRLLTGCVGHGCVTLNTELFTQDFCLLSIFLACPLEHSPWLFQTPWLTNTQFT